MSNLVRKITEAKILYCRWQVLAPGTESFFMCALRNWQKELKANESLAIEKACDESHGIEHPWG